MHRFARGWAILATLRRVTPIADHPCRTCVRRLVRAGVLAELAGPRIGRKAARTPSPRVDGPVLVGTALLILVAAIAG